MADWSGSEEGREEHERGAGAGERRKSEEEVFTLLFREVDREDRGEVSVEALIEYLQRMQLGRDQTEEVSDSTADVSPGCLISATMSLSLSLSLSLSVQVYCVRYNLQLLKTMLEEVGFLSLTHAHFIPLPLTYTHTCTHALSLSHTHTYTHSHTLFYCSPVGAQGW